MEEYYTSLIKGLKVIRRTIDFSDVIDWSDDPECPVTYNVNEVINAAIEIIAKAGENNADSD